MHGVECDNPIDGKFKSGGREKMAMWMMDMEYCGRSLCASQLFFAMDGVKAE